MSDPCSFLEWDSLFFGFRIACVSGHRLDPDLLRGIDDWCDRHRIDCLTFLADADHAPTVTLAQERGFRFLDIRTTLTQDLTEDLPRSIAPATHVPVRLATPADIPLLQAIARTSHRDTRFYSDPHFPRAACDALYETWIKRHCEGEADAVYVAARSGNLVGYASCQRDPARRSGRLGLVGVAAEARRCGIGNALVTRAVREAAASGVRRITVVTQGKNAFSQRLYQRCGFLTHNVQLWFHRWKADQPAPREPAP